MTIPGEYYVDERHYDDDERYIAENMWLLADHASRIQTPGDYFVFEYGRGESVIILRDPAGEVKGYQNVYRHRGSRLCRHDEGPLPADARLSVRQLRSSGNTPVFRCPYHAWLAFRYAYLMASYKSPGKAHSDGLPLIQLMDMFPTEEAATAWFEEVLWSGERCCGKCGSVNTRPVPKAKPMPYWCSDCRSYFSIRTGTPIARSNVPLRKWAIAIYLCVTSLKSVSSMKLHRDIGVSQPAAWFMLHRIREAWALQPQGAFVCPVEADETFVGGKEKNKHEARRLHAGRGPVGKIDRATKHVRATVVPDTAGDTLRGFVVAHTADGAMVYTDGDPAYDGLPRHEAVKHSVGEYVRGMAHTNGMESF